MAKSTIRVVLANDHMLYIEGLKNVFAPYKHISVIGTACSYDELLQILPALKADILILDDQMPGGELFHTLTEVKKQYPEMNIILHSMMDIHASHVRKTFAFIHGWFGFTAPAAEIIKTIESVYDGGVAINIKGFERENEN